MFLESRRLKDIRGIEGVSRLGRSGVCVPGVSSLKSLEWLLQSFTRRRSILDPVGRRFRVPGARDLVIIGSREYRVGHRRVSRVLSHRSRVPRV